MAKPVLKWAGGKRQLLDDIYARFPADYDRYFEPFLGGGAVFFDLEPARATVNDANPRLVTFYEQVRDSPEDLIDCLREFRDPESDPDPDLEFSETDRNGDLIEQYYYQQRARFNRRAYGGREGTGADAGGESGDDESGTGANGGSGDRSETGENWPASAADRLEEAALLLYLNRTCYNGLYRENSAGGFNVPIGRYADPDWVQADRIRAASRVLEPATLDNADFADVLAEAGAGDLVYCDPPYEPMSATADFAEYSAGGFDRDDQERLLDAVCRLDDRGVHVVLSNSGVTYDRYTDAGFAVSRVSATRAINSDETGRDAVDEVLVTNVPESERAGRRQRSLDDYEEAE